MAMQAKLFVDGEFYNLKEFDYGFINGSNANGFSSGKTRQTGLNCVIEAIRQPYFEEWAMEDYMKKYVEVHITEGVSSMGRTRILKFHDTFLLELHTRFNALSGEPMSFELKMKSGAIEASWSTAKHIEAWGNIPKETEPTVIENNEPQVLETYYTDLEGNPIEPKTGQEVYLILNTKDAVGETIDIDLGDSKRDFIYNDQVLDDDMLMDFKINTDSQKIKLRVIEQNDNNELEILKTT